MAGSFHVRVVSPEKVVYEGDAFAMVAPARDGQVGILPGHAPFLSLLGGRAEAHPGGPGGGTNRYHVAATEILKVEGGTVTAVLTEYAGATASSVPLPPGSVVQPGDGSRGRRAREHSRRLDLHPHHGLGPGPWSPEEGGGGGRCGRPRRHRHRGPRHHRGGGRGPGRGGGPQPPGDPALEVELHLAGEGDPRLGYFVDPLARPLVAHGQRALTVRQERIREPWWRGCATPGSMWPTRTWRAAAGPDRVGLGRPHLARSSSQPGMSRPSRRRSAGSSGTSTRPIVPHRSFSIRFEAGALDPRRRGLPVWAHPPGTWWITLLPEPRSRRAAAARGSTAPPTAEATWSGSREICGARGWSRDGGVGLAHPGRRGAAGDLPRLRGRGGEAPGGGGM
ncbi:MAG: F0F1 ATP synthase subunit epsilon [Desulfomicrobium escambiense]|nr:F0F1 ATP synthase subunit epsilon [Desulfomicrobium escambiense]